MNQTTAVLMLPVSTSSEISQEELLRLVKKLIDVGICDAQDSTNSLRHEADPDAALASSLIISSPSISEWRSSGESENAAVAASIQYVITSDLEYIRSSEGAGFWNNSDGWQPIDAATLFSEEETQTLNLPLVEGNDARWVPLEEARTLVEINEQAKFDGFIQLCSLDGGETFKPAPDGVRVIYQKLLVPGEDGHGELHINLTVEGLITDLWVSRDASLDHNLGTSAKLVDDIVGDLAEQD